MERLGRILCCAGAVLGIAATDTAAARGRHAGGAHGHAHFAPHTHVRRGFFFVPAFGSPYYAPVFLARPGNGDAAYAPLQPEPVVYVEQFAGTPTPDTQGEIYCAERNAHYPEVAECPGGWQRVFRPQVLAPQDAH